MPVDKKLENFISVIMADSDADCERINAEISKRREAYLDHAENEILGEIYSMVKTRSSQIKTDAGRLIARRASDNKRDLHLHREKIAEEIFASVRTRILEYVESPEYPEALLLIAQRAGAALQSDTDFHILLRNEDMKYVDKLRSVVPGEYTSGEIKLGGLIAYSERRGMLVDLTYDAAMANIDSMFAEISDFGSSLE